MFLRKSCRSSFSLYWRPGSTFGPHVLRVYSLPFLDPQRDELTIWPRISVDTVKHVEFGILKEGVTYMNKKTNDLAKIGYPD